MFPFLLTRPRLAKVFMTVIMAAQLLGWLALARASEPPPPVALSTVRSALREFDRFLDHYPLLEDELRLNPALTGDSAYLKKCPELRDFLSANPDVVQGLKHYPRYFLFRALLREASVPLRYSEIAKLREVLDEEPAVERALAKTPEAIRDATFLQEHARLRSFFEQHSTLAQAFLPHT